MSTDLAAALANHDLGTFEGADILSVGIEMPGAGGGLRDALKIEPATFHKDEEVMVLVRGKVGKVRFDPVRDTQGVSRVHVLIIEDATIVDGEVFSEALEAQAEKIDRAREAAEGIARLPLPDELEIQHREGAHAAGLVDGCADCEAERDAEDAEADT